ncbi:major facilitator superfamily protein, putative [Ichthyophthirius multifiliis]|uniref:Major facilitator superfamily protein, putative n=1 Tax=Ichthyophthirius multifiliis TaxID=5932 RepID=G0QRK5_ICHMU|nr:major facilitator superfamily protein, putative [Ichthyophthirius multifiliis]EGR32149.1 major facilitator superfamily protein, putative [Ichthyophthirius multifiliis]|eukprot:XP_004035635.1 major facilitator superfamily protein, putative [Ichthyophthirius multifiliis]
MFLDFIIIKVILQLKIIFRQNNKILIYLKNKYGIKINFYFKNKNQFTFFFKENQQYIYLKKYFKNKFFHSYNKKIKFQNIKNEKINIILFFFINRRYSIKKIQIQQLKNRTKQINKLRYINKKQEYAYSLGYFINDLCSACWFNFYLYLLKQVFQLQYASFSMLSGQIFDAFTSPLVGYLSDKTNTKFGKRIPWYICGLIVLFISFFPIFHRYIPIDINTNFQYNTNLQYFYFIFFPSFFNIGWSCIQISHMSLLPQLTCSRIKRDKLNNLRITFTFVANSIIFICGLFIFQFLQDYNYDFEVIGYIVLFLGGFFSILFLFNINERKLSEGCDEKIVLIKYFLQQNKRTLNQTTVFDENKEQEEYYQWFQWMKQKEYYRFGFIYIGCRLYCNIISTMLSFYLINVVQIATQEEIVSKTPIEIAQSPFIIIYYQYYFINFFTKYIKGFREKTSVYSRLNINVFFSIFIKYNKQQDSILSLFYSHFYWDYKGNYSQYFNNTDF